jgi:hypothetical protein
MLASDTKFIGNSKLEREQVMDEYSRIVIERYCRTHNKTEKSSFLWSLLELSYTMECEPEDWEAFKLEQYINRERSGIERCIRRFR